MKFLFSNLVVLLSLFSSALSWAENPVKINVGFGSIKVLAQAPIPEEVKNETQARALSREAAIVQAQSALLLYVLNRTAHSGKTLAQAQEVSLKLQEQIRGTINGARVDKTVWEKKTCTVVLVLEKRRVKSILKKN
ncbi:MAG: hypothetical protein KCHDKBKB_00246 [Elusimicrobia bacterium]|nr:hypothetical protein [Elusimicrobiota bacterium]